MGSEGNFSIRMNSFHLLACPNCDSGGARPGERIHAKKRLRLKRSKAVCYACLSMYSKEVISCLKKEMHMTCTDGIKSKLLEKNSTR